MRFTQPPRTLFGLQSYNFSPSQRSSPFIFATYLRLFNNWNVAVPTDANAEMYLPDGSLRLFLFQLPELPRIHSFHPVEEAGEGGNFREVELVGDLSDAERGLM